MGGKGNLIRKFDGNWNEIISVSNDNGTIRKWELLHGNGS